MKGRHPIRLTAGVSLLVAALILIPVVTSRARVDSQPTGGEPARPTNSQSSEPPVTRANPAHTGGLLVRALEARTRDQQRQHRRALR